MKKYLKEIIIFIIQLLVFYFLPLTAGPADMMGLVVLMLILTFVLSIIMGCISNSKLKYFYPIIASIIFIPTVFIYYNESALIHSVWYLVDSIFGLLIGVVFKIIFNKIKK